MIHLDRERRIRAITDSVARGVSFGTMRRGLDHEGELETMAMSEQLAVRADTDLVARIDRFARVLSHRAGGATIKQAQAIRVLMQQALDVAEGAYNAKERDL